MKTVYVTDELIHEGFARKRGAELELSDEVAERLIESGQVSTSKPKPLIPASEQPTEVDVATLIGGLDDEDLVEAGEVLAAQLEERGLTEAPDDSIDYSRFDKPDLIVIAERRELEVKRGDGGSGDPVKDDYVKALAESDAAKS